MWFSENQAFQFFFIASNTHQSLVRGWIPTWIHEKGITPPPPCEPKPCAPEPQGLADTSAALESLERIPEGKIRGKALLSSTEILQLQQFSPCVHLCLSTCVLMALYVSPSQICPKHHKSNCLPDASPKQLKLNTNKSQLIICLPSPPQILLPFLNFHLHEWHLYCLVANKRNLRISPKIKINNK